jgi:hypothetical protein
MPRRECIGIALAPVKPGSPEFGLSKRARVVYVNALALAADAVEFEQRVRSELQEYGLELIEFEDAETLNDRLETFAVSDELVALADSIAVSDKICFDTFRNYFGDDEIQ